MGYGLQGYPVRLSDLENNFRSWSDRVYDQVEENSHKALERLNSDFDYKIKEWPLFPV